MRHSAAAFFAAGDDIGGPAGGTQIPERTVALSHHGARLEGCRSELNTGPAYAHRIPTFLVCYVLF
jgi:hypothetical protein